MVRYLTVRLCLLQRHFTERRLESELLYQHSCLFCALCPGFECKLWFYNHCKRASNAVLHNAENMPAAVRAAYITTATRTPYGQVHMLQAVTITMYMTTQAAVFITRTALLVTYLLIHYLCAVSWIWNTPLYSIQLCDRLESYRYSSTRCYELNGGCQGAQSTNCHPHVIWGNLIQSGVPYSAHLGSGILYYSTSYDMPVAFGIRCVLDLYCSNILQTSGLQLCDHGASSSYGAAQCQVLYNSCQGAYANHCYPYDLWSGSEVEGSSYHRGYGLYNGYLHYDSNFCGTGMYAKCVSGYAFAVRCVLGLSSIFCCFSLHQVYSCATSMRALSTALYSAKFCMAAVRALRITTASRITFGQVLPVTVVTGIAGLTPVSSVLTIAIQ